MQDSHSRKPAGTLPTVDNRQEARYQIKPVEYTELGEYNGGIILNMSEHGMAVSAAEPLGGDRILRLRFQLPGSPNTIETLGEISWIGESRKRSGIRFVDLPESAHKQIRNWISLQPANLTHDLVAPETEADSEPAMATIADQTNRPNPASPFASTAAAQNFSTPEQSEYPRAKPEDFPAEPAAPTELQPTAFLARPALSNPDRRVGISVSEASASDVASDSGLPALYRAYPLNVAPKKSSNLWKVVTLIVLIGGACFGGGIYFSQSRRMSSTTRPAVATNTELDGVTRDVDRQPGDKPSSKKPQSKELVDLSNSGSPRNGRSGVPVEGLGSAQSRRRAASSEPATTREKAGNFVELAHTRSPNQAAAARQENRTTPVPMGADDKSKLESEADARLNQESKPATVSELSQQLQVASDSRAFGSSAATREPYTAGSNSAAPAPVRGLVPSVSFFSRFRSIRASSDGANLSASGELQIGSLRSSPAPIYPAEAQQRQVQGMVELDVMVGSSGEVQSVRLVKGPVELAGAAKEAVRGWEFAPTLLGGHPVETEQTVIFTFKLGN